MVINIDATSLNLPSGFTVATKPLSEAQKAAIPIKQGHKNKIDRFGGYSETALSIFLIFKISKDGTVYSQFLLPIDIELPRAG